jgi:hypothetical protein
MKMITEDNVLTWYRGWMLAFVHGTSTVALANARVLFVECEHIEVFFFVLL